jgi:multiple sugar transport system ATP-binding protein
MDEPLSNLDAKLRVQMRAEISKLAKRLETTVIYVTHDQTEAMTMGDRIVVMDKGIIQQAATPEEIYNFPVNMFVAGFIGSPSMNFVTGGFADQGGSLYFKANGISVEVPEGKAKLLREKGYVGKEVIMGVRPEDLHEEPVFLEASPNTVVNAHIEVAENLGHEMFLYLTGIGKNSIVARVDGRSGFKESMNVKLAIDMNKVHFFDQDTTLSILLNA